MDSNIEQLIEASRDLIPNNRRKRRSALEPEHSQDALGAGNAPGMAESPPDFHRKTIPSTHEKKWRRAIIPVTFAPGTRK